MIIEGSVSLKAAILGNRRKINKIFIDKNKKDHDTNFIIHRANDKNIPIEFLSRDEINNIAKGRTHGGILGDVSPRTYQSIDETICENAFIVVLEGVEDPFNLGYVCRSLYSAGCCGLILRKRDWSEVESIILKSSAGAYEYINIILSENIAKTISKYKELGFNTYAAMRKNAISYLDADFTNKTLIAIGGEMRGLSSSTLNEIDQNIFIPYANDFKNALNASGAASVLGFEVFRQRNTNCDL